MTIINQQLEAIQFQLQAIAGIELIQSQEKYKHVETDMVDMMLEQVARFSEEFLLELAEKGDIEGCQLVDGKVTLPTGSPEVYRQWCELGFPALGLPMDYDGLDFPRIVQSAIQELADGANLAFGMLTINLRCAALALIKNAPQTLVERWVPGLVSGEISSTIAISEPQAGSDVGRISVKAKPTKNGNWLVSGSKIWTSFGDHDATEQIIHLVLARVPGGELGTRGLGLFAVPKYRDDNISPDSLNGISPLRLEHKMGLHASPTCVIEFENAEGFLIGEPGKGIQNLFVMMNAMRLAVAVQGSAVANAATLHAIEYAKERPQGGRPDQKALMISEHADVKRMLLEMTAQSELLRALSLRTAFFLDMAEAQNDSSLLKIGELLLPIAKTVCAEMAFDVASKGIQVLGGYGYTNDYPLERLARDVRVCSIYEGTSGIQALDLIKRKIIADGASTLNNLLDRIKLDINTSLKTNPLSEPFSNSLLLFESTLAEILSNAEKDKHSVESGAYGFLRFAGIIIFGWNALALFEAATADSEYHKRLRAALSLFASNLEQEAKLWAGKSLQKLEAFEF